MRAEIKLLHQRTRTTTVYVTHDQVEAMTLGDRVVVMNEGRVEQVGTPDEVYDQPASPFVYQFLGDMNVFHGRVHDGRAEIGGWEVALPDHVGTADAAVYVRPHDIEIFAVAEDRNALRAVVTDIVSIGPRVRVSLSRADDGSPIQAEIGREVFGALKFRVGDTVAVQPRQHQIYGTAA